MSELVVLEVPGHRIALDLGGDLRATSWQVDGMELLGHRSRHPAEHGMYAMGPWAGRIDGNRVDALAVGLPPTYESWALHGTVLGRAAEVIDRRESADRSQATAVVDLGPSWPRAGWLKAHWEITPTVLSTRLELIAGDEPFPGVVGWHPWFTRALRGVPAEWHLGESRLAERTSDFRLTGRLVPANRRPGTYDDAFHTNGRAVVSWPGVLALEIVNSAPWFVVYDMPSDFVCLEPQSGPPNGVNVGLVEPIAWAAPGSPVVLETHWRIMRAQQAP